MAMGGQQSTASRGVPSATASSAGFSPPAKKKRRKWTTEECEMLRRGVEKHGEAAWKVILHDDELEFNHRSNVDIKDKWRNMNREKGLVDVNNRSTAGPTTLLNDASSPAGPAHATPTPATTPMPVHHAALTAQQPVAPMLQTKQLHPMGHAQHTQAVVFPDTPTVGSVAPKLPDHSASLGTGGNVHAQPVAAAAVPGMGEISNADLDDGEDDVPPPHPASPLPPLATGAVDELPKGKGMKRKRSVPECHERKPTSLGNGDGPCVVNDSDAGGVGVSKDAATANSSEAAPHVSPLVAPAIAQAATASPILCTGASSALDPALLAYVLFGVGVN